MHDNVGYTPYEGRKLRGWPITVLSRGRIVVEDGALAAPRGSGAFLPCALSAFARPAGAPVPEFAYTAEPTARRSSDSGQRGYVRRRYTISFDVIV